MNKDKKHDVTGPPTPLAQDSKTTEFGPQSADSEQDSISPTMTSVNGQDTTGATCLPAETPLPEASARASDGRARRKKRTRFKVPDWKPRPIKALWESATDDDRERAHNRAMVILEYWTAQLSKTEAAERLGLAPIRIWQLSQQAVSGMVAGLLTQPRDRGTSIPCGPDSPERWTARERALEKQLKTVEQKLEASQRLVEVMRDLPVVRASREADRSSTPSKPRSAAKRKRSGKANRASPKGLSGSKPGSRRLPDQ